MGKQKTISKNLDTKIWKPTFEIGQRYENFHN